MLSRVGQRTSLTHFLNRLAVSRLLSTTSVVYNSKHAKTILAQLDRAVELQSRVAAENSKKSKAVIISEYPDLRELLEYIYQPALRLHLSGKSLDKYINGDNAMIGDETPTSLIELFDQLANKEIVGNEAKAKCLTLLVNEGIVGEDGVERPELLDVFYRLLDRSLTAGFSASTLKAVNWGPAPAKQGKSKAASKSTDASTINLDSFSCALGKALDPPFNDLFNGKICSRWWASRKLDGVRCVTYVDFFVPKAGDPQVKNIQFLSRKGNEFTSLGNLERQLIGLAQWPGLRELLARDPVVLEEQPGGHVKRLVLDGEVCVMRPMTSEERALREQKDDGCTAAQDLWLNDGLTEDFQATVSRIKRRNQVIPHPAYFVFDVLSAAEFAAQGAVASPGLGLTFGKRIRDIEAMGSFWAQDEHPLIRVLVQREVMTREDLDGMVQRASDEGWEGIMLRADTPYKGKRSKELFKLKKWKEEEYIVVSAHNNVMRLPVDGVFEEREACANVIIEHKGHPVSIGSGFSSEQRLRFARDPGEIVGKQITVEYFGESEALDRPGVLSLRFPRIKTVWEEGKRSI